MKEELSKDIESLKKEPNRNPGNKKFLKSNKKHSWKPFQETGTSGGHNFRLEEKINIKEKAE
jgi:hypothetical protein